MARAIAMNGAGHRRSGTRRIRRCPARRPNTPPRVAIPQHLAEPLAAVVHALVAALRERHLADERAVSTPSWRIDENRWSACRHGVAGTMADLSSGEPEPTRVRLERLLDALHSHAESLGCARALGDARWRLTGGGAPATHRALAAERGLPGLVSALCDRFHQPGE